MKTLLIIMPEDPLIYLQMADRTPLPKKAATSQDIVPVVSMLASKECDFMTGERSHSIDAVTER